MSTNEIIEDVLGYSGAVFCTLLTYPLVFRVYRLKSTSNNDL